MSHVFNPYSEWLGVAPHSDPPTYYELLDLRPLESDTAKIETAYRRQSAKIAAQLSGQHVADAQRLMGELGEARMTLLTPTAKRAYDAVLTATGTTLAKDSHAPSGQPPHQPPPSMAQQPALQSSQPGGYGQPQAVAQPVHGFGGPGYGGQPAGYAPAYAAQPLPAAMPVYPAAQAYPAWQGQSGAVASAPPYVASEAPQAAISEDSAMPEIRRRRVPRRSSPMPAVIGALVILVALGGGWLYYSKHDHIVAALGPKQEQENGAPADKSPATAAEKRKHRGPEQKSGKSTVQHPQTSSAAVRPPAVIPAPVLGSGPATEGSETSAGDGEMPVIEKPAADKAKTDSEMAEPDKPAVDKMGAEKPAAGTPEPEKTNPEKSNAGPSADAKASPEEAAAVGKLLNAARAALTARDVPKAQDLLAEATIEATSPDMTSEVGRVELLASYVEMFWDAVRQTLPKIALEELEINGTMLAVVEADENHLIVRAEGRNREYTLKKLPHDIAYYLANRWLAPEDPLRNLVLASFEIVDAKGDRSRAQSLLDAAEDAKLKSDPLREELQLARDGR